MRIAKRSKTTRRYREPMTHLSIMRYETLKRMNLNARKMDLRIAAIVLEHTGVLATDDTDTDERWADAFRGLEGAS